MKIQQIPVSKCVVPAVRVTAAYDADLQKLLTDTVSTMGQLQPITVINDGERYIVTDGKHRLEEAIRHGQDTIDAVVYQGDARQALLQNLVINNVRGKTKASELVVVMASLFHEYNMEIEQIVKETGYSQELVEKYLKVSEASDLVRELLDDNIIGIGVAYELSRLPSHLIQDEIASEARVYRYTVKDLKEKVDQVLYYIEHPDPPQEPAPPPPPVVHRCQVCSEQHELSKLQAVAMCPDCYSAVYKYARDRKAKLEEVDSSKKE